MSPASRPRSIARAGARVAVVTKAALAHSATQYAQGGVAAVLPQATWEDGNEPDSPALHLADTLVAGAGLCDADAVRVLVEEGPAASASSSRSGAPSTRPTTALAFTRRGRPLPRPRRARGRRRHRRRDRAGARRGRAGDRSRDPRAAGSRSTLIVEDGRACGVRALDPDAVEHELRARHTVLATGGAGQCFAVTTNPTLSTGDGIALALRGGRRVGRRRVHAVPPDRAAPLRRCRARCCRRRCAARARCSATRTVSRSWPSSTRWPTSRRATSSPARSPAASSTAGLDHVWLDARRSTTSRSASRRSGAACRAVGLDPTHDLLPVAPAAHYLSGGVVTDLDGATTLPALGVRRGRVQSGVHGANRLASNSLLDGLVFGARCVDAIAAGQRRARADGPSCGASHRGAGRRDRADGSPTHRPRRVARGAAAAHDARRGCPARRRVAGRAPRLALDAMRAARRRVVRNLWSVSRALVLAAIAREESRGTHTRLDFPETVERLPRPVRLRRDGLPSFVPLPAERGGVVNDASEPTRPAARRRPRRRRTCDRRRPRSRGDITAARLPTNARAVGDVVVRADGRPRGHGCATEVFAQVDPDVAVEWRGTTARTSTAGTDVGGVDGPLRSILHGERTALNFLCHLSGVATLTRRFVTGSRDGARVLDTRKTLPGLRALRRRRCGPAAARTTATRSPTWC